MKRNMLIMILVSITALSGCLDEIEETPLVIADEDLQAPTNVRIVSGDGRVTVYWSSVAEATAYRVYRSASLGEVWVRVAETVDTFLVDVGVSNGVQYLYGISSVGVSGIESGQTEPIRATPSAFSLMINGGVEYTGSRAVTISLTAPSTTSVMKLGNTPDLGNVEWETYAPVRTWLLPHGDGVKYVYAQFQDANGSESPLVSSTIELDTYASIEDLTVSPTPYLYTVGSTIHLAIEVEDYETEGTAGVDIEGLAEGPVALRDDGRGGDMTAGDGVYETDYTFPSVFRGTDLIVTGIFTDRAGNEAEPYEWAERISFTDPPEAVNLIGAIDSTTSMITIRWEESAEDNFMAYRIYRNTQPGVTENPAYFIRGLDFQTQTTYPDGEVLEGMTYYYRIFVVNDLGETAGSNEIAASTFDAYPTPAVLDDPTAIGTDRLTIEWTINPDADFSEYRIYRATSPGVTVLSSLVAVIDERETVWFDDEGLDNGSNTYYYRVLTYDLGGKYSRSNEVSTVAP